MLKNKKISVDKFFYIEVLLCGVLIFVLEMFNIDKYYCLINGVDEYGYLSCALYLSGKGSLDIASTLSYYSFGYSILLVPLVKFISDPIILFRSILIVNYLCIVGAFFLSVKVVTQIEENIPNILLVAFCCMGFLYVSNYINSKYVFSESLLVLMIWIIIYMLQSILKKYSIFKMIILEILCVYLYFIHQRTISIVLAMAIIVLVLCVMRRIPISALMTVAIPLLFFLLGQSVKKVIIDNVYLNSGQLANNDYTAQFAKIRFIFSIDGFISLLHGLLAKIYYFNLASFFISAIGMLYISDKIVRAVIRRCREKDNLIEDKCYLYLFMIISFIFAFLVQVIFLIYPTRYDLVIYGRYIDYLSNFFIIFGFVALYRHKKDHCIWVTVITIITIIGAFSAEMLFERYQLVYSKSYLAPGLFVFFDNFGSLKESILITIMISITLGFIYNIYLRLKKNKFFGFAVICLITIIFWGWSLEIIESNIVEEQSMFKENYFSLAEYINNSSKQVYYYFDSQERYKRLRQVQYLCPDQELLSLTKEGIKNSFDCMVLTDSNEEKINNYLSEREATLVYKNYMYKLWYLK